MASTLQTTSYDWSRADGFQTVVEPLAFPAEMSATQCASTPNLSPALSVKHTTAVAFAQNSRDELRESDVVGALTGGGGKPGQGFPAVREGLVVRRLTPVEYERLQGFPDNFTAVPWAGKPAEQAPDGHRCKALGNSMAVPVVRWLGERLQNYLVNLDSGMGVACA